MLGRMMSLPLSIPSILDFADRFYPKVQIVSRTVEGPIHRYTYADAARRVARLANVLTRLGVGRGDIVGTLAWNGYRHVELYYAIAGIGAVCHTVNPRLFPEQIHFIINHARDRYVFVDLTFVPLLEKLAERLPSVQGYIILTDRDHMPQTSLSPVHCYEDLLEPEPETFPWPDIDERQAASLCYTSGTTGDPRGVLYSHRSTVLHAMAIKAADAFGLSARDVGLAVVPMFHVNAWGMPYVAPMSGATMVLPGPALDGASLAGLITSEGVTVAAGVPTVWMSLLAHVRQQGGSLAPLNRVIVGGSACPAALMDQFAALGVETIHAWGMTETSPLGTINQPTRATLRLPEAEQDAIHHKQGRPLYGVDLAIVGPDGAELPFDGTSFGPLRIRGHWVCDGYYRMETSPSHGDSGWFDTGDVATIDPYGYMQIVDRVKDVIKSGGEWISSIELENVAIAHPAVFEAAAIARPDPKWGERPLVIVVLRPGHKATEEDIREFYRGRVAKWCEPDKVIIAEELPHTATGKILKQALRRLYAGA